MKKNQLLQIVLGILTVLFFLTITFAVINLSNKLKTKSLDNYVFYIGPVVSFVFLYSFKKKRTYFLSGITVSILFVGLNFLLNNFGQKYSKRLSDNKINWNNVEHNTTLPFYVSNSGHIYFKSKIGNETKYIMFDTGADLCAFNEKYNNSKETSIVPITDSQGRTDTTTVQKLKKLSFKNIYFEKVNYISINKDTWNKECGFLFNRDSIAGILGNNLINSFVWDFDMLNKTVKLSEKIELQDTSRACLKIKLC